MSALTELFTDIANAIRNKTGSAEQIEAANFANEIANISGGFANSKTIYARSVGGLAPSSLTDDVFKGGKDFLLVGKNIYAGNYTKIAVILYQNGAVTFKAFTTPSRSQYTTLEGAITTITVNEATGTITTNANKCFGNDNDGNGYYTVFY